MALFQSIFVLNGMIKKLLFTGLMKVQDRAEQILTIFTAAHDYLKGVMNDKTALPVKAWKAEYAKLTAERKTLNQRYLALKGEVKEAEQIRKSVYNILRQEQRERP